MSSLEVSIIDSTRPLPEAAGVGDVLYDPSAGRLFRFIPGKNPDGSPWHELEPIALHGLVAHGGYRVPKGVELPPRPYEPPTRAELEK